MFSVEDGTEVTAVPKDSILWGICKEIYKTRARILQGCFLFGDFQNPVSDKILWDLISKLPFLILLQKFIAIFPWKVLEFSSESAILTESQHSFFFSCWFLAFLVGDKILKKQSICLRFLRCIYLHLNA